MRVNLPLILVTSLACGLPMIMEGYGRPMPHNNGNKGNSGACINAALIPQLINALGVHMSDTEVRNIVAQLVAASSGKGAGAGGAGGAGMGGGSGSGSQGGSNSKSSGNGGAGGVGQSPANVHQGQIMWAKFKGNACGVTVTDPNALLVAVRGSLWKGGAACGQNLIIQGPKGNSIMATIADTCDRGCGINLSKAAFAQLENPDVGVIQGAWMPAPAGQE